MFVELKTVFHRYRPVYFKKTSVQWHKYSENYGAASQGRKNINVEICAQRLINREAKIRIKGAALV